MLKCQNNKEFLQFHAGNRKEELGGGDGKIQRAVWMARISAASLRRLNCSRPASQETLVSLLLHSYHLLLDISTHLGSCLLSRQGVGGKMTASAELPLPKRQLRREHPCLTVLHEKLQVMCVHVCAPSFKTSPSSISMTSLSAWKDVEPHACDRQEEKLG